MKKKNQPLSPILALKMVIFVNFSKKYWKNFYVHRISSAFLLRRFFSFQNYSCQIFTQFSFKNCKFQPFYPPQNDTYVHVHNCKPPWVHLPHNCYAVHALMYCVALSHCISELRQEFWGTSPEQPTVCNDIKKI